MSWRSHSQKLSVSKNQSKNKIISETQITIAFIITCIPSHYKIDLIQLTLSVGKPTIDSKCADISSTPTNFHRHLTFKCGDASGRNTIAQNMAHLHASLTRKQPYTSTITGEKAATVNTLSLRYWRRGPYSQPGLCVRLCPSLPLTSCIITCDSLWPIRFIPRSHMTL